MNAGTHLTTDELSERLRVSVRTLESWRSKREGPAFAKFGSRVLYPLDQLIEWELKQIVGTVK